LKHGLDLEIQKPITIIVGSNGSGKSTILEAIAAQCGFSLTGGTKNIAHRSSEREELSSFLRLGWLPKVTQGFFFRAETFFNLVDTIDQLASESGEYSAYTPYGGSSMRAQSHGQSFMAVFENRFGSRGTYIIDEPEAALSPERQMDFIRLMRKLERKGDAQIIMATHSPMIMAYPSATLLEISNSGLRPIEFHETNHFKIMRNFCLNPDGFMDGLVFEADELIDEEDV
jgi:predicted ATPase